MKFALGHHLNIWSVGAGCGVIALAGSFAIGPAFAGGGKACDSATPCLTESNKGAGPGLSSASAGGNGLAATTTFASKTTGAAAVSGVDLGSGTINNSGVEGVSALGVGVFGQTTSGIGVRAVASSGTALAANATSGDGVFGTTQSSAPGVSSTGVFGEDVGTSSIASGVTGFSGTGIGVQGENFERGKFLNSAFLGMTFSSSITTHFPAKPPGALFNSDIGEGVVAESSGSATETLQAANFGGGPIMRGYQSSKEVMELDNAGNLILAGKLTQHGNPKAVAHTASAGDVVMYASTQSVATVEDLGEARLTSGEAYVRLDPRFGATMNAAHGYMVFVTPQGDTSGLYVTQKTQAGFAVREHGGRSTVAFDYRIVGEPYGPQAPRLPAASPLDAAGFAGSVTHRKSDFEQRRGVEVRHD